MANYPKSKEEKLRSGTYRPDREKTKHHDPFALDYYPDPPETFKKHSIESNVWKDSVKDLVDRGILYKLDLLMLDMYCRLVGLAFGEYQYLEKNGNTYTTSRGTIRERPQVKIANNFLASANKLGKQFYLDPLSRSRLPKPRNMEVNPFEKFIN